MSEAITQYVDREEKRESFRQDALKAWEAYRTTGLHVTDEEADVWLANLDRAAISNRLNVTADLVAPSAARCSVSLSSLGVQEPRRSQMCREGDPPGVKVREQQPRLWRPVEDMIDELRDWIIDFGDSGYMARYPVDADAIMILLCGTKKWQVSDET